jgi:hypothetical protein
MLAADMGDPNLREIRLIGARHDQWMLETLERQTGQSALHSAIGGQRFNPYYSGTTSMRMRASATARIGTEFGSPPCPAPAARARRNDRWVIDSKARWPSSPAAGAESIA